MIAIQKDIQTHLGIQIMNKDTHNKLDPFIQFNMSDGITYDIIGRPAKVLLPACWRFSK